MCQIMVATANQGMTYQLEMEREDHLSDHGCNCEMMAGMTYLLEVEGDLSDLGCDCKMSAGTTYRLEVERESDMSDCGYNYK
jgi:hypothetical protein